MLLHRIFPFTAAPRQFRPGVLRRQKKKQRSTLSPAERQGMALDEPLCPLSPAKLSRFGSPPVSVRLFCGEAYPAPILEGNFIEVGPFIPRPCTDLTDNDVLIAYDDEDFLELQERPVWYVH